MRLCNCLWGGRYNPIIPIFENIDQWCIEHHEHAHALDVARGYIDFFEPDVLVEASPGMADRLGWKSDNHYFELPRVIPLENFFELNSRKQVDFSAGIDICNIIAHLYDLEYKYQRRHKRPFAIVEPAEDAFFELFGGAYPNDETLAYIPDAYRDVFEPEALSASPSSYLKFLREGYAGPAWITRHALEEASGRRHGPTIFILNPKEPQDLIDGWNYRLVERNFLPVNLNWLAEHADFLRERIQEYHRPIPGNPFGTMFHTNVEFSGSVTRQTAAELLVQHFQGLPQSSFFIGYYPTMWRVERERFVSTDRRILINSKSESFDEEVDADGYARIPTLAPDFHDRSGLHTHSCWINVIEPGTNYRNHDIALVYPSNLWQPGYPRLQSSRRLTITREGWATPERYHIGYSLLRPAPGRQAMVDWFETQDIRATPSEAGQVAAQVISSAGGLLACGMFADKETILLLNSMAENHSEQQRDGKRIRRTIPDRAKHRNEIDQHFIRRAKRSFGFWNRLEYFLDHSVFRAGLRVQCPTCAYYNWFDLDAISYDPTCNRCLKKFKLGQTPKDLRDFQWFYRVIGPFAAPDYVRGGYAVALTLRCIAERHESELTWSTGLELSDPLCEIDFAAWYRRGSTLANKEREEPVFVVGEAKSFGRNAIDSDSIESLRQVGERFSGAVLIVSSLKSIAEYTTSELDLLKNLARWGRARHVFGKPRNPVIVLTGTELFAVHGIREAWRTAGGNASKFVQHAATDLSDLHQLAECTQQLYLGLPPFHADFHELSLQRARQGLHLLRARIVELLRQRSRFYRV
jgi:hypothetical protein